MESAKLRRLPAQSLVLGGVIVPLHPPLPFPPIDGRIFLAALKP